MGLIQGSLNSLLASARSVVKPAGAPTDKKVVQPKAPETPVQMPTAQPTQMNSSQNKRRKRPKYAKAVESATQAMMTAQAEKRAKRGGMM